MAQIDVGSASGAVSPDAKAAVQDFQVRRLKRDFRDLRLSSEYGPLCDFFAAEIYSAKDFTERNASFRRVTSQFRSILGDEIYSGLTRLLDLHALTDRLDDLVAAELARRGTPTEFTEPQYERVYKDLDNFDDRRLQIDMILDSFRFTHHVSQLTFIGMVLKSARVATGIFSKNHAIELLDRAYRIMREVRNIEPFVVEIGAREHARLARIYGRER
jgi:hypothetical protein